MRTVVMIGLAVVLAVVVGVTAYREAVPVFRGTVIDPPIPAPDFTLTDQYGRSFRLSDQKGYVVLMFFGYTHCPDVCPTTLATWKQVHDALGKDADRVRFVFITVDPERDTPERIAEHLSLFHPDFIGLTGTMEEMERVYQAYHIYREQVADSGSAVGYLVNHTSATLAIDPQGRWRITYSFGTPADDIAHDIRGLLR